MINGVRLPTGYNAVGLHDTPGASTAAWGYADSASHARLLREHGVTVYKILADTTNKVVRCRAYVDNGIVPVVRPYQPTPWGTGLRVTPADQLRPYVDVGVQLFELGNEFNIAAEWKDEKVPNAAGVAVEVCNWWEVCLRRAVEVPGLIPLFPSNTPGGNVDHRLCYRAIIAELSRRGLLSSVKHIAVHPRPHNNPPDTTWTATNTVTFDEWRWIRDQFEAAGVEAYYWATEHGYSVGDSQNSNYPVIDLAKHTAYNHELFLRMNLAHARAIEPELAGVMYWFEAGWGHWGAWPKDALRDSIVPEMPAPSPLWGVMAGSYQFSRYDGTPVPVPGERQPGIDVSEYQGVIDWSKVAASGVKFAMIRASVCRSDGTLARDARFIANWAGAKAAGVKRGAYHYLHESAAGQAAFFAQAVGPDRPELGYWADVEDGSLTAAKVEAFLAAVHRNTGQQCGVYTSASFFDKWGIPGWAGTQPLWVAHWGVDKPALPKAWSEWAYWQHTNAGTVPGIGGRVDLDWSAGEDDVEPEPPPEPTQIVYRWYDGTFTTEAKFRQEFGDFPIVVGGTYHVSEAQAVTGPATFRFRALDTGGQPVVGRQVVFWWPDAPACPGAGYEEAGVIGLTKADGYAEFGMGGGAYYWPQQGQIGPHKAWVYGAASDQVGGIGMIGLTEHDHFDITVTPGDAPPPVTYRLTVSIIGQGNVVVSPLQTVYAAGTVVTLTAVAAAGWRFSCWAGAIQSLDTSAQVTMDRDKAVTASFVEEAGPTAAELVEEARALMAQADALLVRALGML